MGRHTETEWGGVGWGGAGRQVVIMAGLGLYLWLRRGAGILCVWEV